MNKKTMARRKKKLNLNLILIGLALVAGTWITADYYFNVARRSKEAPALETTGQELMVPSQAAPLETKSEPVASENSAFETATYRDDRFGFEFQYPVAVKDTALCPKLEKTDDGFYLGIFSLAASISQGDLADHINNALQGMNIDKREEITIGGRAAIKIDYQTAGMGWYGSSVFVENNGRIFEFGLLANEVPKECGGVDNYEDLVYQSVISTFRFDN